MRRLRFGAFALMAISMAALAASYVPPPDFRGYVWGKPQAEFPKLVPQGSDSGVQLYSIPGMDLSIGQANAKSIQFGFYKQRFSNVFVNFEGDGNAIAIKAALVAKYGEPSKPNQFVEAYFWGVPTDVAIIYRYSEVTKVGSIYYGYQPLMDELRNEGSEAAKKAAGQI